MSEMGERVARAIAIEFGVSAEWWDRSVGAGHDHFVRQARAAIEAMREPTELMKVAGERRADLERGQSYQDVRTLYGRVFESMIDEALK